MSAEVTDDNIFDVVAGYWVMERAIAISLVGVIIDSPGCSLYSSVVPGPWLRSKQSVPPVHQTSIHFVVP